MKPDFEQNHYSGTAKGNSRIGHDYGNGWHNLIDVMKI